MKIKNEKVEIIITIDGKQTKLYVDSDKLPVTIELRDEKNIIFQSEINTNIKGKTEMWDTTTTANEKDGNIPKGLVWKITNAKNIDELKNILAENIQYKDFKSFKYYVKKRRDELQSNESEKTDNGLLPKWLYAQLKNAKTIEELKQINTKNKEYSNRQIYQSLYSQRYKYLAEKPFRSEWD